VLEGFQRQGEESHWISGFEALLRREWNEKGRKKDGQKQSDDESGIPISHFYSA
jgi:hypothetical protein